jgi:nucleotide-binding universal stress UspA family protein
METLLAILNEPKKAKGFIGYVARLSKDLDARVHMMYVQEPYDYTLGQPPASGYTASIDIMKRNAEEARNDLAGHIEDVLKEINGEVSISYSAEIDTASMVINKFITEGKASMVVLEGEEQESFWSHTSSNIDIVNHIDCPVWIIPFEAAYKPLREIVYATDFKEEDIPTLKNLIGLTFRYSPVITALHITDSIDFEEKVKKTGFKDMLQSKTGYQNITVKSLIEKDDENVSMLINEYALNINANLIVVLKENKNFFERILRPSATKKILKEATLPVLIYKY